MKKIISISLLALATATFVGCSTVSVDKPNGDGKLIAMWTTRTLQDIRFYKSSVEEVSRAAEQALRDANCFVTHYTSSRSGNEINARGLYDVKITVDITRRKEASKKDSSTLPLEYTEVAIVYGTWGDLPLSQNLASMMMKYLPNEN